MRFSIHLDLHSSASPLKTTGPGTFGLVPVTLSADTFIRSITLLSVSKLADPLRRFQRTRKSRRIEMKATGTLTGIESSERKSEKGVTTVEYAVMLVLVAIAVLTFGSGIADSVTGVFSRLAAGL